MTDRLLKALRWDDFVYVFQQSFLRLHMTCGIKRRMQKLGHNILRWVSKFLHSDHDS